MRNANLRRHWVVVGSAAAALALAGAGCAVEDDPDFNPYAPPRRGASVLQAAEQAVGAVDSALNALDRRMDHRLD